MGSVKLNRMFQSQLFRYARIQRGRNFYSLRTRLRSRTNTESSLSTVAAVVRVRAIGLCCFHTRFGTTIDVHKRFRLERVQVGLQELAEKVLYADDD